MKRATLSALALLAVAELTLGIALYRNYHYELDRRLEFHGAQLHTGIVTIVDSYRQVVEILFQRAIQRPEIIDLLAEANVADRLTRNKLRGRLYRQLYPLYELLREHDIRVLQFVLSDGRSFLRFNRPDLYDDSIAKDRPVLNEVLRTGRPGQAFENGRVYPGFRYSFPLLRDGQVVAVADFSAAFDALNRVLLERERNSHAFKQLLIRRDLMQAVAHPSATQLFRPTPINPAFVQEDETSSLRDISLKRDIPDYVGALDRALEHNQQVTRLMNAGKAGNAYECLPAGGCFIVSLRPVPDSFNRPAGFIVVYTPTGEILTIRNQHLLAFFAGSLLLLGAVIGLRRWLASRQQLQTISQNMAEGMYVMDPQGKTLYVNPAASELLGYSEVELRGAMAHDLFHLHSEDRAISAEDCPIREEPMLGRTYKSNNQVFVRKDGARIRVSVSSSPLREGRQINGSVVLFRDVTAEHETRQRLQQSDIAFRNLAEAVVVTDADSNIQAVNRAFTTITGYQEEEVLGRNPRLLASGRHDDAFYDAMWRGINHKGNWQGEIWNRRKNGEIYPEWLNISVIRDDENTVMGYVSVFSDVTEIRHKEARLQELALHDQLTNLPNRASFQDIVHHAIQQAKRKGSVLALLYLDLDRFKHINDSLGHIVGDRLLQAVAKRMQDALGEEYVVARLGGDEMTVLLEDVAQEQAPARIARKILAGLQQPFEIDEKQLHITASIGISLFPRDGQDLVTLLKNADAAMYLAKQGGRDDYCYFTESIASEAERRFTLESELRSALRQQQFVLYYQPKTRVQTGEIIGFEALLRWRHPDKGLLEPRHFLEIAKDAGMMPGITEWVVRNAARQLAEWSAAGLAPGRISVNLDDQTFNRPDTPQLLKDWIRAEGATHSQMELEVTETVMLRTDQTDQVWKGLLEAGFELSIDDFGTGESSLFRLKHLPVHTLKVDKSFVDEIDRSVRDRAVFNAIVTMAKSLGKRVLAEGVERSTQLETLRQMGCDHIQGFYIGKPSSAEQTTALLKVGKQPSDTTSSTGMSAQATNAH